MGTHARRQYPRHRLSTAAALLRIRQWVKNAFVFAPLLFAQRLTDLHAVASALAATLAFSLAASAIYIFNDIVDRDRDRHHPTKRDRPIAAGKIAVGAAAVISLLLAAAAGAVTAFTAPTIIVPLCAYATLNVLYTLVLKRVALFDVIVIAIGFVLRVESGSAAIGEPTSSWMILTTLFIALFLGLAKRRGEQANLGQGAEHRPGSELYSLRSLDILVGVSLALTIIAYALYTVDPQTIARFGSRNLVYTVPIVIFGMFRYFVLVTRDHELADPTEIVTRDSLLIATVAVWSVTVALLIYVPLLGGGGE